MKTGKLASMNGGWFVGDFAPAIWQDKNFEVAFKTHHKGEYHAPHLHKIAHEINVVIHGKIQIQGQVFEAGDIFVMEPGEVADPQFLEDCELIVVKVPSVMNDKYLVD